MHLNKKSIAVSTASLVVMGGTAFAYYSATGTGTAEGQVTADSGTITLGVDQSDWGHITDDGGYTVRVYGANSSTRHSLRVSTLTPATSFGGGTVDCPTTAFTTSAPIVTHDGTTVAPVDVPKGTQLTGAYEVGTFKVTMNSAQNAKACEGVNITLGLTSA
jgi:hypothetical protein